MNMRFTTFLVARKKIIGIAFVRLKAVPFAVLSVERIGGLKNGRSVGVHGRGPAVSGTNLGTEYGEFGQTNSMRSFGANLHRERPSLVGINFVAGSPSFLVDVSRYSFFGLFVGVARVPTTRRYGWAQFIGPESVANKSRIWT